ncbi:hypothetical protein HYX12_04855 [Candidatus Woesearchaeota archaeon]|nr:hypothetical protein [Candidatus Woesearchaeota archaeon]
MDETDKVRLQFNDEIGLTDDYYNVWAAKALQFQRFSRITKRIPSVQDYLRFVTKGIPHYGSYLKMKYPKKDAKMIIRESNKDAVSKLNSLADAYNGRLQAGYLDENTFTEFFLAVSIIFKMETF